MPIEAQPTMLYWIICTTKEPLLCKTCFASPEILIVNIFRGELPLASMFLFSVPILLVVRLNKEKQCKLE